MLDICCIPLLKFVTCLYYYVFTVTSKAKLAERGNSVEGKSQLDKNCGDHKKLDIEKNNCQCVCHIKTGTTTDTAAGGPAVIDLIHSPCKGKSEPATSAAEHGKHFIGITLIKPHCTHLFSIHLTLFICCLLCRSRTKVTFLSTWRFWCYCLVLSVIHFYYELVTSLYFHLIHLAPDENKWHTASVFYWQFWWEHVEIEILKKCFS